MDDSDDDDQPIDTKGFYLQTDAFRLSQADPTTINAQVEENPNADSKNKVVGCKLTEKSELSIQVNYDRQVNRNSTSKEGTAEITSGTSPSEDVRFDGGREHGNKITKSELTTPMLPPKKSNFGTTGGKIRTLSEANETLINQQQQPKLGLPRGRTNTNHPESQETSLRNTDEQFEFEDIAMKTLREPGVDKTNVLDSFALVHFHEQPEEESQANET